MLSGDEVLGRIEGLTRGELMVWIERGWVAAYRRDEGYLFSDIDLARVRLIHELKVDLAIEDDALSAVLSLVDQVYGLRHELRLLTEALRRESDDVRARILRHVEHLRKM